MLNYQRVSLLVPFPMIFPMSFTFFNLRFGRPRAGAAQSRISPRPPLYKLGGKPDLKEESNGGKEYKIIIVNNFYGFILYIYGFMT